MRTFQLPTSFSSQLPTFFSPQTRQLKQHVGTTHIFETHIYNWNKTITQFSGVVKVLSGEESLSAEDQVNDFCYKCMVNYITEPWWPKPSSPKKQPRMTISLPFSIWKKQYPNLKMVKPLPHFSEFRVKDFPFAAYFFTLNLFRCIFVHLSTINIMTLTIHNGDVFCPQHHSERKKYLEAKPLNAHTLTNQLQFQIFFPLST